MKQGFAKRFFSEFLSGFLSGTSLGIRFGMLLTISHKSCSTFVYGIFLGVPFWIPPEDSSWCLSAFFQDSNNSLRDSSLWIFQIFSRGPYRISFHNFFVRFLLLFSQRHFHWMSTRFIQRLRVHQKTCRRCCRGISLGISPEDFLWIATGSISRTLIEILLEFLKDIADEFYAVLPGVPPGFFSRTFRTLSSRVSLWFFTGVPTGALPEGSCGILI